MISTELIIAIGASALALLATWLWRKGATDRLAKRLYSEALAYIAAGKSRQTLYPEYRVALSENDVVCSYPGGKSESIRWNDLERVAILNTDEGPFAPDVFWVLFGSSEGFLIPWGATGEKELLERLQTLPGFRSEAIVKAASIASHNELICWERPP